MRNTLRFEILDSFVRSKSSAALVILALLSSCGAAVEENNDVDTTALQRMRAESSQLVASFLPIDYTDMARVPIMGSASYNGYISAQLSNRSDDVTDTLIGELHLEVDFAASDMVTGSADGFLDDTGSALTGTLNLSGGSLDRDGDPNTDATFTFEGTGELVNAGGRTLVLLTTFEGDFLEENLSGVGGDVLGQVIVDGSTQSLGGFFIGTR